jgi:CRP-like cAMP-binding protein
MASSFTPSTETLSSIGVFRDLSDGTRGRIARKCQGMVVKARESVVTDQNAADDVYFVENGCLRAYVYSVAGKEITFRDLRAGEMFGEIAALGGKRRSANIIALEKSRLVRMSGSDFKSMLAEYPEVNGVILKRLALLVLSLSERVVEFSSLTVKDRVRTELLRYAMQHTEDHSRAIIDPLPTHAEIASRINTHREAVTRELNALVRQGIVERDGNRLIVTDVPGLEAMVNRAKGSLPVL